MSHMGTYVCTAVEYVGKAGSRVSVYLRVIEGNRISFIRYYRAKEIAQKRVIVM